MASSIIGAVAGGLVNKAFAGKGSKAMQQGADQASEVQKYMYDTTREDLAPYRNTGTAALNRLSALMGLENFDRKAIENQLTSANPNKYKAAVTTPATSGQSAKGWTGKGGTVGTPWGPIYIDDKGMLGSVPNDNMGNEMRQQAYTWAMSNRAPAQEGAPSNTALDSVLQSDIDAEIARQKSDPSYGSLAKKFSLDDYEADPGYKFRLDEGQKAIERSQAAKGGLYSGAAMKEALRYGQDMGSQEYGNTYNRFMDQNNTLYNRYANISNQGMGAVNSGAQNNQNYANNMSGIYGNLANANAASAVNQGNQLSQSLGSLFGGSQYGGGWSNSSADPRWVGGTFFG